MSSTGEPVERAIHGRVPVQATWNAIWQAIGENYGLPSEKPVVVSNGKVLSVEFRIHGTLVRSKALRGLVEFCDRLGYELEVRGDDPGVGIAVMIRTLGLDP